MIYYIRLVTGTLFRRILIREGVKYSAQQYGKTYRLLEKYDRGEVSATKYLAEYKRLQNSLRNTVKTTQ